MGSITGDVFGAVADQVCTLVRRAALCIGGHAGRSIWAVVCIVHHAVIVLVVVHHGGVASVGVVHGLNVDAGQVAPEHFAVVGTVLVCVPKGQCGVWFNVVHA